MKKLIFFNVFFVSLMLATAAQANTSKHLFCKVAKPCKDAASLGNKCCAVVFIEVVLNGIIVIKME